MAYYGGVTPLASHKNLQPLRGDSGEEIRISPCAKGTAWPR